ncbi:MAG: AgmX/PglI C-terminal domain-containing protein [Bacteroidales bacterium]
MLVEEPATLNAQIQQVRKKQEALEEELRAVEAELETFSVDRQSFKALQDVCNALDRLGELEADDLFWEGITKAQNAAGHLEIARSRISRFEEGISGILENQQSFQKQIDQCLDELSILYEEVNEAHEREEKRKEAFIIDREISSVPYRPMVMPWTKDAEDERHFRRAVFLALLICFIFGGLISLIKVPIPDRSTTVVEIPERLVQLVKKEALIQKPARKNAPKQLPEKAKDESQVAKKETKPQEKQTDTPPPVKGQPKVADSGGGGIRVAARKKAETVGIMAFKDAFKDLMKETPVAKLGTEARLNKESLQMAGRAVAQRSLVSIQGQSDSSGGIGDAGISRNIGNSNVDRLGGIGIGSGGTGVGIARVSSNISNLEESSRPTSDGVPPGRTDEEIQIVFDRYKAALYRIYNKELRKDPTLRGKILMRISIETSGAVSMCKVESTDLGSLELVAKIVERIKRFNFGPKEGVQKVTILYPIDFLPAG